MKKSIPILAGVALAALAVVAYYGQRAITAGPTTVAGSAADGTKAGADKSAGVKNGAKGDSNKAATKGGPGGPAPVEVIALAPTRVIEDLSAVGSLRANQSVLLRTEVTGRVAAINFRDGQPVKRGRVLVALDASLNEAEVAQAKAELSLAQANLRRTEDLASKNFVSGSAQDQAASSVSVLVAKLQLAQARLDKMRVVAPFDGVVGLRSVSVGDVVRDGTDLVNVEDINTLKVDFRVPERYFTQLKVGQPVELLADALPGTRYSGRIDAINPRIDANGRSLEVRAALVNSDGRLRPGMFARVRVILGDRAEALLVPEEAIVPQGDSFVVFRVVEGKAQRVPVRLGVRRDGQVELLDNVKAGDRIVTAGIRVQRDGQPVRVVNEINRSAPGGSVTSGAESNAMLPPKGS